MIQVTLRNESGYEAALYGMSLSHSLGIDFPLDESRVSRAAKLAPMQGGHNKCLEAIMLWLDVNAPRYWWQQADTYRISTKQSESTMHTILKGELGVEHFAVPPPASWLDHLNKLISEKKLDEVKALLPEGFMQRRLWCLSYKTLQNIDGQRKTHKLQEWRDFLELTLAQIEHPELIRCE